MKAAMFSGQGSQYIGMGKDLFDSFPSFVEQASNLLGYSLSDLCDGNPPFAELSINRTMYSQPAIFVVSCLKFLQKKNADNFQLCLGHSLGLIAALFAAEVIDFAQGIAIVKKRAELMDQAPKGAMAAVIGSDVYHSLRSVLIENDFFDINIANYNGLTQLVISGSEKSVFDSRKVIESAGFRFIQLPVSGAFHSRLMNKSRIEFSKFLIDFEFNNPKVDVISTINGEKISADFVFEELTLQLEKPVRWYETVVSLRERYPDIEFEEFGPGSTLTNLNRHIFSGS